MDKEDKIINGIRVDRFTWKAGDLRVVKNENLQCHDCEYLYEKQTAECEMYEIKPRKVLLGENACTKYKKKE